MDVSNAYPFVVSAITPDAPVITNVKVSGSSIKVTYKAAEMEKSKAVRTLNSLIEKKILKKTGAGRGVRYTLK